MSDEPKTILVVEDEVPLRKALVTKLEREGFNVLVATNGKEGIEQVHSGKPDLIMTDMMMPEMDGQTMLTNLKQEMGDDLPPVIVLTNLNSIHNIAEMVDQGASDFLVKANWKLSKVMEVIRSYI